MEANSNVALRNLSRAFIAVLLLELCGEVLAEFTGLPIVIILTKPLLMPLLALMVWQAAKHPMGRSDIRLLLAALFFSWLGDLLLMGPLLGANFFVFGLGAFLLAHLCYIVLFADRAAKASGGTHPAGHSAALLVVVFGVLLLGVFQFRGNEQFVAMKIPVIAYTATIIGMVLTALYRYGRVPTLSFRRVFAGALLFMISDSVIGLSRFTDVLVGWELLSRLFIMTTYGIGQWYIVRGMLHAFHPSPDWDGRSRISI